jgi:integrase/recombinase XerD
MPKPASFAPQRAKWAGSRQWKVELPAGTTPSGKRERMFFGTKQDASNFSEEQRIRLKNHGTVGMSSLNVGQLAQAATAFETLKPYQVTLNEVVTEWITRKQASEVSISFEAAMDGFLDRDQRSASYTRSIRQTRNRLKTLHGKLLNAITPEDLTLAMDGMPGSVRNFTIRILGGLFNFGIKRGYCVENPCKKLDLTRAQAGEIEIYAAAEVAKILTTAEKSDPELVPFLALSFFCGLRRAEVLRLDWSAVDLYEDFVKLPAAITKARRMRHVEISDNCKAWISPHSREAGHIVASTPDMLRKRLTELRTGHHVPTIKHGARHCFASYWLAKHGDINQLCRFLGHDDPETTFKHYAKAATKREAEKYWAISPGAAKAKNVIAFRRKQTLAE